MARANTPPPPAAPSAFARAIVALLDDTDFNTRAGWARMIGVSTPAISQWVKDRTVPRPDVLRLLLRILRARGGPKAAAPLEAFDAMARRPSNEVSPLGARLGPTVEAYLARSPFRSPESLAALSEAAPVPEPVYTAQPIGVSFNDWFSARAEKLSGGDSDPYAFGVLPRLQRLGATGEVEELTSFDQVLKRPLVLIVGAFGSGKSHVIQTLASHCERGYGARPPVLLGRHLFEDQAEGFWADLPVAHDRPAMLFVDGLDEAPITARHRAVHRIEEITEQHPQLRMVIASRPTPELDKLQHFEQFSIAPLSDVEVVATLTQAIAADPKSSPSHRELRQFMCHLSERPNLLEPLRNPLFLKTAWSLFTQSAVTPFSDGELVGECVRRLMDRDHMKGLNRVRAPWASQHSLTALLGELAFHMLKESKVEIDESDLNGWIGARTDRAPADELLQLLLVQGLLCKSTQGYSFAHKTIQEYFAANYVVESVEGTSEFFSGQSHNEGLRSTFRLACGIANDATSLLKKIIESDETSVGRYALLAEILAQPVTADASVVDKGCGVLVKWLDDRFQDWSVDTGPTLERQSNTRSLYAKGPASAELRHPAERCLKAIHRARSGPAYRPLKLHLKDTRSELLPVFADWMDVEGRLDLNFMPAEHTDGICASIGEPRLV